MFLALTCLVSVLRDLKKLVLHVGALKASWVLRTRQVPLETFCETRNGWKFIFMVG
jgi:hypothetical protein